MLKKIDCTSCVYHKVDGYLRHLFFIASYENKKVFCTKRELLKNITTASVCDDYTEMLDPNDI